MTRWLHFSDADRVSVHFKGTSSNANALCGALSGPTVSGADGNPVTCWLCSAIIRGVAPMPLRYWRRYRERYR
jgi:hypothetical protein